jgi:hypothetical protein
VLGNLNRIVFTAPSPVNRMGGHKYHGPRLLPSLIMSYHTPYTSLGHILDEAEVWQGIKCARESREWPRMSRTLTVAFPEHVLRWGYLSQGKGSLSSKLQSIVLP